ncbi:MAG TPA: hypothetical protein EYP85_17055 [Armatimonadetes bacterium]|nr:hypothetical protein [Armatimonadota bacterium]
MSKMGLSMGVLGAVVMLGASAWAAGEAKRLWAIGAADDDYREFAIAGNYGAYPRAFPRDVTFVVGQSDPQKDWPYIHPAPLDVWAGRRVHPFKIVFTLDQPLEGDCRLLVDFVNVHPTAPTFTVDINGEKAQFMLPSGVDNAAPKPKDEVKPYLLMVPFSASLLHVGENTITLAVEEASWVIYDAVWLEVGLKPPTKADIRAFEVQPTILFLEEEGELKQVLEVFIDNWGKETQGEVTVEVGGKEVTVPLPKIGFGRQRYQVGVPEVEEEQAVKATLRVGEETLQAETTLRPARKWRVFVAPSTHTDIGYTDIQDRVVVRHNENTEAAIAACQRWPGFKWNLEVSWQAQNYLRDRPEEAKEEFLRLAKAERLGVQALYLNMLTGLCSHEELNRLCYFAARLKRLYGIPMESAMLTDVPTSVWTLPTVLARSGVKYFAEGINQTRGPFFWYADKRMHNAPFWWEGPDGSKVLTWFTGGYAQAGAIGLYHSYERVYRILPRFLAGYDREDYPYDAVFLYGAFGDNQPLNPKYGEVAAEWNAKWAYPRIILSTNAEFFRYIEERFGEEIPTFRGGGGCFWEDGAASSARETALNRRTHEQIVAAEKLHSIAAWLGLTEKYPREDFHRTWDKVLLYDEHTWGAHSSISRPESEFVKRQWAIKSSFATDAARETADLLQSGLDALAKAIETGSRPAVLVFNSLSWARSDLAQVELPAALAQRPFALVDRATKRPVPYQLLAPNRLCFLAEEVPPLGCKTYELVRGQNPLEMGEAVRFSPDNRQMENEFFRLTFDPQTGGLSSIYDKELQRELVDQHSPYKVNQYLYVAGGEGTQAVHSNRNLPPPNFQFFSPKAAQFTPGPLGPVCGSLVVETSAKLTPQIRCTVTLYRRLKRIDIVNEVVKEKTYAKEAVYFAFPFAFPQPAFQVEIPNGVLRPELDQLKGACKDWYCVQHWVDVSGETHGVTWSTPDSPLICLGDINPGKWLESLPLENGTIFAYVMNNYWFTNYLAGQGGQFTFRYAITAHGGGVDPLAAVHFSWSHANPFLTRLLPPGQPGRLPSKGTSFCTVTPANVIVLTVKRAEDGPGFIVRLFETRGKATEADLSLPHFPLAEARLCNLVEEEIAPLSVEGRTVHVPVEANGIVTLRVR